MLALVAAASALTAGWLLLVVVTILPSRDPSGGPSWALFALALLAFSVLTVAELRTRPARWRLVVAFAAASVAAIVVGLAILVAAVSRTTEFEGYLVVIGLVVSVDGMLAAVRAVADVRSATRPAR